MVIDGLNRTKQLRVAFNKNHVLNLDIQEDLLIDTQNLEEAYLEHPIKQSTWMVLEDLLESKLNSFSLSEVYSEPSTKHKYTKTAEQKELVSSVVVAFKAKQRAMEQLLQGSSRRKVLKSYSRNLDTLKQLISA